MNSHAVCRPADTNKLSQELTNNRPGCTQRNKGAAAGGPCLDCRYWVCYITSPTPRPETPSAGGSLSDRHWLRRKHGRTRQRGRPRRRKYLEGGTYGRRVPSGGADRAERGRQARVPRGLIVGISCTVVDGPLLKVNAGPGQCATQLPCCDDRAGPPRSASRIGWIPRSRSASAARTSGFRSLK